jgi:hypothetical protein
VRTEDRDWLELLARDLEDFFRRARDEIFARVGIPPGWVAGADT